MTPFEEQITKLKSTPDVQDIDLSGFSILSSEIEKIKELNKGPVKRLNLSHTNITDDALPALLKAISHLAPYELNLDGTSLSQQAKQAAFQQILEVQLENLASNPSPTAKQDLEQRITRFKDEIIRDYPIHTAVRHNLQLTLQYLIAQGIDINTANEQKETPLSIVCTAGNSKLLRHLSNYIMDRSAVQQWLANPELKKDIRTTLKAIDKFLGRYEEYRDTDLASTLDRPTMAQKEQLIKEYAQALTNADHTEPRQGARLYMDGLTRQGAFLQETIEKDLLGDKDPEKKQAGSHDNRVIGGLFFKKIHLDQPSDCLTPIMEYAAGSIFSLLANDGIAPNKLAVVVDEKGESHIYSVTYCEPSVELGWFMQALHSSLDQLEPKNLSFMTVISAICGMEDYKPDNIVVQPTFDGEGKIISANLVGIDNDRGFIPHLYKEMNNTLGTRLHNVFFCLSSLSHEISDEAKNHLITKDPTQLIEQWFGLIEQSWQGYQQLFKEANLSPELQKQFEPRFLPGTVERVYQNLTNTIAYLKENQSKNPTHEELLRAMDPTLELSLRGIQAINQKTIAPPYQEYNGVYQLRSKLNNAINHLSDQQLVATCADRLAPSETVLSPDLGPEHRHSLTQCVQDYYTLKAMDFLKSGNIPALTELFEHKDSPLKILNPSKIDASGNTLFHLLSAPAHENITVEHQLKWIETLARQCQSLEQQNNTKILPTLMQHKNSQDQTPLATTKNTEVISCLNAFIAPEGKSKTLSRGRSLQDRSTTITTTPSTAQTAKPVTLIGRLRSITSVNKKKEKGEEKGKEKEKEKEKVKETTEDPIQKSPPTPDTPLTQSHQPSKQDITKPLTPSKPPQPATKEDYKRFSRVTACKKGQELPQDYPQPQSLSSSETPNATDTIKTALGGEHITNQESRPRLSRSVTRHTPEPTYEKSQSKLATREKQSTPSSPNTTPTPDNDQKNDQSRQISPHSATTAHPQKSKAPISAYQHSNRITPENSKEMYEQYEKMHEESPKTDGPSLTMQPKSSPGKAIAKSTGKGT